MQYITNSPAETEAIGAALGRILEPGTAAAETAPFAGIERVGSILIISRSFLGIAQHLVGFP